MAGEQILMVWILALMSGTRGKKVNIALRKLASTSLGFFRNWTPDKAVDGDNDINGHDRTCFHGAGSPSDWTVDLGQEYQLYDIRVYLRKNFEHRTANSIIYVDNNSSRVCYTFPPTISDNPTDVTCNGTAQYVTIRNPGTGPGHDHALSICEVEIYVCSNGTYGSNCSNTCGLCSSLTCDRWTGFCIGDCEPGYRENKCDTVCSNGTYGINCTDTCGHCASPPCDRMTGVCSGGCAAGYRGNKCDTECDKKHYGSNCSSLCVDRNCYGMSTCDHVTGSCDKGCQPGWKGTGCRKSCDREHYGPDCTGVCITRNCEGSSTCNLTTGQCDQGCQTGWAGIDCTQKSETSPAIDQTVVIAVSLTAVGVVILILVIVGVMIWRRRQIRQKKNRAEHAYYNTASESVKVKDGGSEVSRGDSLPSGHYGSADLSRDTGNTYTTIDDVDEHAIDPMGVANTPGDYEPVLERKYETLNLTSRDQENSYTGFERSYENVKHKDTGN